MQGTCKQLVVGTMHRVAALEGHHVCVHGQVSTHMCWCGTREHPADIHKRMIITSIRKADTSTCVLHISTDGCRCHAAGRHCVPSSSQRRTLLASPNQRPCHQCSIFHAQLQPSEFQGAPGLWCHSTSWSPEPCWVPTLTQPPSQPDPGPCMSTRPVSNSVHFLRPGTATVAAQGS